MDSAQMGVLLASAIRSASNQVEGPRTRGARGVMLIVDVTVAPGGDTLTPQVEVHVPGSDTWEPITAFAASAAGFTGEKVYIVYPGAVETAAIADQEMAGIPLPYRWRLNLTHSAGNPWTYSVSYYMLP